MCKKVVVRIILRILHLSHWHHWLAIDKTVCFFNKCEWISDRLESLFYKWCNILISPQDLNIFLKEILPFVCLIRLDGLHDYRCGTYPFWHITGCFTRSTLLIFVKVRKNTWIIGYSKWFSMWQPVCIIQCSGDISDKTIIYIVLCYLHITLLVCFPLFRKNIGLCYQYFLSVCVST
jgi:hypothetical protein